MAQLSIPLEQALALPPEELGALLEPGLEYTGTIYRKVPLCGRHGRMKGNRYVRIDGTLPTLAAAMDKPELLRFLLDHGHDINSASQTAVEALLNDSSLHEGIPSSPTPFHLYPGLFSANRQSSVTSDTLGRLRDTPLFERLLFQCDGATPLVAAIVCGSTACVRVLLERPGVWGPECPAISAALALDWRAGDAAYAEACRLVRVLPDGTLRPLVLRAIIDHCSEDFLRNELATVQYDAAAIRDAADELLLDWRWFHSSRGSPATVHKLSLLAEHGPTVLQTPVLRGRLASLFLCRQGDAQLLALIERFCPGHDIDLGYAQHELNFIPIKALKAGLKRLCAIGRPVLSCDVALIRARDPEEIEARLRLLFEYVRFLPGSYSAGLSSLTRTVLNASSLSLLELALEKGAIPASEPLDAILELIRNRPALRAALLMGKRPEVPPSPPNWTQPPNRSFPKGYMEGALDANASSEHCRAALLSSQFLFISNMEQPCLDTPVGRVHTADPVHIFSMQGKVEPLRSFLSAQPQRYDVTRFSLPEREGRPCARGWMSLTPLCAAALAGQTGTVEMLLALGYDANERDVGLPSLLHVTEDQEPPSGLNSEEDSADAICYQVPLPPLLCAMLSGNPETESLLRAHGAAWDMETENAKYAIEVLRA